MHTIFSDYRSYYKSVNRNVGLYFGILIVTTVLNSAYNILFGIYLKNLGFNEDIVGQVLSLRTLGIAIGAVPVAILVKQLNQKKTLLAGLLIMGLCSLGMINIPIIWMVNVFALLFGIGNATVMVLQAPILYENTKEMHRVTAFSTAFVLRNVGFVLGSLVLGYLSDSIAQFSNPAFGNRVVLNAATLLLGVAVFLALRLGGAQMLNATGRVSAYKALSELALGYRDLLRGKTFKYLIQVALVGAGAGMIVPFFSIYLKYSLDISDGMVGSIMAVSQMGTILGGLIVPPLSKKIGRVNTVIACQLLSIPFLISISFPQGIGIVTLSFFFRSSLMNMASPVISSMAMEICSDDTRTFMSSLISLINNLFRSLGIYVGGYIMYNYSYNMPYYGTILCYLLGTLILYRVFGRKGRETV